MDDDSFLHLGNLKDWADVPIGIYAPDRRQHLYVIGKSGTGKTTLLRNLILQDIEAGRGVGVLDPHGDLALDLLSYIPPTRIDDVLYFNPADTAFPVGFNPLRCGNRDHLTASGIVASLKNIWGDSWGPRLEYILYASVSALLECDNTSFLGIQRMLSDTHYRAWVIQQVKDPWVRYFWLHEFAEYESRYRKEAVAPIQNKVGQLLMASPLRNILGQVANKVDARFVMDDERIFVANLSKGALGEDKAHLLGALLVTQFQLAAMGRQDAPEQERKDFHLYVDEFQSFATESFLGILSEARKYRLCLTLSHQYMGQLSPTLQAGVFGNVGSIVSFRVGFNDAEILAEEFGGRYNPKELRGLGNYEVTAKLLTHGEEREPFLGKTLPPLGNCYGRRDAIIARSRERFSEGKDIVEERIVRWLEKRF